MNSLPKWQYRGIRGIIGRLSGSSRRTADASEATAARLLLILGMSAPTTAAVTSVSDTNVNTTLLASNASRKGAVFVNDSSAIAYVKCGATASTTSYTVALVAGDYWELPFGYTGQIDCIWASDSTGAMRITEFT